MMGRSWLAQDLVSIRSYVILGLLGGKRKGGLGAAVAHLSILVAFQVVPYV